MSSVIAANTEKNKRSWAGPSYRLSRQIVRVLALIDYLRSRPDGATVSQIFQAAAEDHRFAGVCQRTIRRDLATLVYAGVVRCNIDATPLRFFAVQPDPMTATPAEPSWPFKIRGTAPRSLLDELRAKAEREIGLFPE